MNGLWRGSTVQRLRLVSGLLLFLFALTHFLNHAMGLVSLDAMIAVDHWRIAVTRSAPGTLVLTAALLIHVGLAIGKLAQIRSWRMPRWQLTQLLTGFAIPFLLLPHIFGTRVTAILFGVDTSYPYVLTRIWPATILDQTILLLLVWVHGCIGVHFWVRHIPAYIRQRPLLVGLAVLIPAAALAGVMMQARALTGDLTGLPDFEAVRASLRAPAPDANAALLDWRALAELAFYLPLLALLVATLALPWWRSRLNGVGVTYLEGPSLRAPAGMTLLEISRSFGVPHVSVCGGRARCSTCRVRVVAHTQALAPPNEAEARTLRAVGAAPDTRLACQWRPSGEVTVLRLVQPLAGSAARAERAAEDQGIDADAAVLFIDIRGFTALSERKLAYDVVHILNRFFAAANGAVQGAGGRIDKFIGDGLMALFSDPRGIGFACRAAVTAATAVRRELDTVNRDLAAELKEPLRLAMGLHGGRLVEGRIGAGPAATHTVIGPVVNVASRLEALAKAHDAELALSRAAADWAALDISRLEVTRQDVRGLDRLIEVVLVSRLEALDPALGATPA